MRLRAEVPAETVVVVGLGRRRRPARAWSRRSPTPTWSCCRRPTRSSRSARSSACPASGRRCDRHRAPVVGLSPIVGGAHVRGMAAAAAHRDRRRGRRRRGRAPLRRPHGRRRARRLAGRRGRRRPGRRGRAAGLRCRAVPLMMTDDDATAAMAAAAIDLVRRAVISVHVCPDGVPEVRRRRRPRRPGRSRSLEPDRRRRRGRDQQGRQQGRGPGPPRHPGGRPGRRDRPGRRPPRARPRSCGPGTG